MANDDKAFSLDLDSTLDHILYTYVFVFKMLGYDCWSIVHIQWVLSNEFGKMNASAVSCRHHRRLRRFCHVCVSFCLWTMHGLHSILSKRFVLMFRRLDTNDRAPNISTHIYYIGILWKIDLNFKFSHRISLINVYMQFHTKRDFFLYILYVTHETPKSGRDDTRVAG